MRILVAEDDVTMRHLMSTILSRQGVTCTVVGDGIKVVEAWEKGGFDCILMDVQMPRQDGLMATRIIREREHEGGGHTTIIAVTAFASEEDRQMCLQSGMDDYISKPVDVDRLVDMIERHVSGR